MTSNLNKNNEPQDWEKKPFWIRANKIKLILTLIGLVGGIIPIYHFFISSSNDENIISNTDKVFIQSYFSSIELRNTDKIMDFFCQDSILMFYEFQNPSFEKVKGEIERDINSKPIILHDILWEKSSVEKLSDNVKKFNIYLNYKSSKKNVRTNTSITMYFNKKNKLFKIYSITN